MVCGKTLKGGRKWPKMVENGHFWPFSVIFAHEAVPSPWLEAGPEEVQKRVIFDPFLASAILADFQGQNALFWPDIPENGPKNGEKVLKIDHFFGHF